MIAIYSFWSKPFYKEGSKTYAGYTDIEMFYCSWILSVMESKKYFKKVVLYTDAKGEEMLSKLNLPFDEIHIVLDRMNHLHEDLWAIPKLLVYSLQTTPFLHIDYDLFWWTNPPKEFLEQSLICEGKQTIKYYESILTHFVSNGTAVPIEFTEALANIDDDTFIPQAGMYGGNNAQEIVRCAVEGLKLIEDNKVYLETLESSTDLEVSLNRINYLVEELYAGMLSTGWYGIKENHPDRGIYGHMVGELKRVPNDCMNIKNRVKYYYPQHYAQI